MLLAKSATVSQDIFKNFLTTNPPSREATAGQVDTDETDDENEEDQGPRMTRMDAKIQSKENHSR
jgi:hypothetical protein